MMKGKKLVQSGWNAFVQGGFMKNVLITTQKLMQMVENCSFLIVFFEVKKSCIPRNSYFSTFLIMIKMWRGWALSCGIFGRILSCSQASRHLFFSSWLSINGVQAATYVMLTTCSSDDNWTARFDVDKIFTTNRKQLKTCKMLSFKKPKTMTLLVWNHS